MYSVALQNKCMQERTQTDIDAVVHSHMRACICLFIYFSPECFELTRGPTIDARNLCVQTCVNATGLELLRNVENACEVQY